MPDDGLISYEDRIQFIRLRMDFSQGQLNLVTIDFHLVFKDNPARWDTNIHLDVEALAEFGRQHGSPLIHRADRFWASKASRSLMIVNETMHWATIGLAVKLESAIFLTQTEADITQDQGNVALYDDIYETGIYSDKHWDVGTQVFLEIHHYPLFSRSPFSPFLARAF